jgi:phosphoserine phosphatase
MELHLIRHGQTDWNEERRVQGQSDSQLTQLGIDQAIALGERINAIEFDSIFCSSSLRTRQTAANAFPESEIDIEYLDSLREIFLGPWEGTLYDEIEQREPDSYQHFWQEPHLFDVAGAESFFELQSRAIDAVKKIAETNLNKRVAIVSHGALIKTILCHVEDRPMSELWTPPHMHNCAHSIIDLSDIAQGQITQYADVPFAELER